MRAVQSLDDDPEVPGEPLVFLPEFRGARRREVERRRPEPEHPQQQRTRLETVIDRQRVPKR